MKKSIMLFVVFVLAVGLLVACGSDNSNSNSNAGSDPEKVYAANCAMCHGGNLGGKIGPKLSDIGSKLSKDEIVSIIQNGTGAMNPIKLKAEDTDAVAAWLADKK